MLRVIGITFDHTVNYGSGFQAVALERAIEGITIGGEPCSYQLIPIWTLKGANGGQCETSLKRRLIQRAKRTGAGLLIGLLRPRFTPFEKRHLRFADVSRVEDLPSLNDHADAFVCGSDAIWNTVLNNGLGAFYLDFAKKYKFSYAASFGRAEISDAEIARIRDDILALDAVSCREASGCQLIRNRIGRDAELVADPVLLPGREVWDEIAGEPGKKGKYIFVYATHMNQAIKDFLKTLQERTGLKIIRAGSSPKQVLLQKIVRVQTPEQWLRQLRDAEYVVTNSFHATAFSVLYHRKFFTVVAGQKTGGVNVRMNDFLRMAGLEDRIFSAAPETLPLGEIDYTRTDHVLEKLRDDSMAFLRGNLEAAWRRRQEAEKEENGHG